MRPPGDMEKPSLLLGGLVVAGLGLMSASCGFDSGPTELFVPLPIPKEPTEAKLVPQEAHLNGEALVTIVGGDGTIELGDRGLAIFRVLIVGLNYFLHLLRVHNGPNVYFLDEDPQGP